MVWFPNLSKRYVVVIKILQCRISKYYIILNFPFTDYVLMASFTIFKEQPAKITIIYIYSNKKGHKEILHLLPLTKPMNMATTIYNYLITKELLLSTFLWQLPRIILPQLTYIHFYTLILTFCRVNVAPFSSTDSDNNDLMLGSCCNKQ